MQDYDEAYKVRRRIEDERDWMCGIYTFEAVSTALGNAFRKKNTKPNPYREKSILAEIEEKRHEENLTDEEKAERARAIFAQLGQLGEAFNRAKQNGGT